ncbi:MAG TPA: hypothetical protein VHO24_12020 [Opitutaceae bacterium]|nr:hypothetical protein [Opitutaceae bacterium]
MTIGDTSTVPPSERLRESPVDQTRRLPDSSKRAFSPARLFADHAFAARLWFFVACAALGFCVLQPYFIINAYRARERVVVLDGAGTFAVSPVLGFGEAKELHESMTLWATLALFQRGPKNFDYPDILQKLFLMDAYNKTAADLESSRTEFEVKNIHQKPEIFKIDILRTREDRVLVRVEGQLIRTGVFANQAFSESPKFTLNLTLVRNPNMLANKRYPLGVWSYDYTLF